jgi:hypothetical protein
MANEIRRLSTLRVSQYHSAVSSRREVVFAAAASLNKFDDALHGVAVPVVDSRRCVINSTIRVW